MLYYIGILILNFVLAVSADEVLGCGGFIKSHVPIDFSKVEVMLVTKQGIIKDKTTAAPNNGYYFVPLYDKGELFLQLSPPPGWSFEPNQVALSVDGITDLCSQGKDINFIFQGFGITGKVESLNDESGGPAGVTVHLESGSEARTTVTNSDGNFFFTPVFPGKYLVSISHPKWKIYKKSIEVKVADANTELPKQSLVIQGYDVKGKVKTEGEPIKDIIIILFPKNQEQASPISGCNQQSLTGIQFKEKYLCHVTTNEVGHFTFGTVPNGQYYFIPYYKGQNIYFRPEKIEFAVKHNSVAVAKSFEIIGFSIPGKVLRTKNVPIANATIFVNGQEVTKTDDNGMYKLEKMKAGIYKLRAKAENVIFDEIVTRMNPSLQELPDILPSAFKISGQVISDTSQTVTFSKVGSTGFIQTKTSPADGSFSQFLTLGKYDVQVIVSDEDKQKGLQFFPIKQTIEVTPDAALNRIVFSQLKTTISGKVQCIRPEDCEGLVVLLRTGNENEVSLNVIDGAYSISEMYPGLYEIILLPNKFCWRSNQHTVNVNTTEVEVPPFIQHGYTVTFVSSHDTQVHFKTTGHTSTTRFDIGKGRSSYCLEKPGDYSFDVAGCHSYDPKIVPYNTDSELKEVLLTARKHTNKLSIQADANFGDIRMSVKIRTETVDHTLRYQEGRYELPILLDPGESAVVVPHSDTLFFTPPILSVEGQDDCEDLGVKFVAVKGKLFNGKILPPLEGVTVTVQSADSETLVVETGPDGVFTFHPLDNKKEYNITAKKESYILSGPDKDGNFLAHKLAEVIVEVLDEVDNSPLPGVLLSLSGGEGYRKNLQSEEYGNISFHSLSPSEYFLRPMMKEYKFEPDSKIIPVSEGETVNIRLIGKRVAYSAFGQVVSLNGESEDSMIIIATGKGNCSQYSEETTCEPTGKFRIRGLQPYCSYDVVVKGSIDDKLTVERTAPEKIEINSINKDVYDLKLIVFHPASQMDILVKVFADNVEHYKSLKIKLTSESGTSFVIHTAKIDTSSIKLTKDSNPGVLLYIPSLPIDHKTYSLQLETNLVQNTKWKPQVHTFNANTSFKFIELDFNVTNTLSEQPIKQTSIWSLIFILIVLFILYNIDFIANTLKDKFDFNIRGFTKYIPIPSAAPKPVPEYYDNAQIDQIVQSINNVKKKPKPKKI